MFPKRMKILLGGGTGFLGSRLADRLSAEGHETILLVRAPRVEQRPGVRAVLWDGGGGGGWEAEIEGADAVVNLVGEPMDAGRWSALRKEKIVQSRVRATRAFVEALRGAKSRPSVLLNASGVGFYGDVPEGEVGEERQGGKGFVAETCMHWEEEALRAKEFGVRVAVMRMGVVLGEGGGALGKMVTPFRFFVGGALGSGRQWFPWIHRDDAIGAMLHILGTPHVEGPVNVVAPERVTMEQFSLALGNVLHRPALVRVPAPLLRFVIGEMADMVLTGQDAVPRKLLASGYKFRYTNVLEALEAIFP